MNCNLCVFGTLTHIFLRQRNPLTSSTPPWQLTSNSHLRKIRFPVHQKIKIDLDVLFTGTVYTSHSPEDLLRHLKRENFLQPFSRLKLFIIRSFQLCPGLMACTHVKLPKQHLAALRHCGADGCVPWFDDWALCLKFVVLEPSDLIFGDFFTQASSKNHQPHPRIHC